ncbi:MAG: type I restriction enzyme HsdR N-terminal domain-containing protein [Microscillaceae bacterium]|nr:type I restriction enzyme HsdR N-terminal domain-containing protein [Microscillaceae bacterium]
MPSINLSEFQPQMKKINDELFIFDQVRKKYVQLFPEEWVRQAFIDFLIRQYSYSKALMNVEGGLKYDKRSKRSDILVFDRRGEAFLLIECKSMKVKITADTLDQVAQYNHIIKAPYIGVTNGIECWIYRVDHQNRQYQLLDDIPHFE